jgi:phosphohistidine phosphatase
VQGILRSIGELMKSQNVLFYRHAKSSWENAELQDFDRPLNAQGKKEAKKQAKKIKKLDVKINHYFLSPSKRTQKTFKPLAKSLKIKKKMVTLVPELYECNSAALESFLEKMKFKHKTILILGHNPSIEDFINKNASQDHVEISTGTLCILKRNKKGFKLKKVLKP